MIAERGEVQLLSYLIQHGAILCAVRIRIGFQVRVLILPLDFLYHTSRDQFHLRSRSREIQIFAAKQYRWAGRSDMNLISSALIKEFRSLPQLCSPYDGIVDQKQTSALNQIMYRYQLHLRNQIPLALDCRHKGAGPGRRIFDKRTRKGDSRLIGITDGMCRSRIRHSRHDVRPSVIPLCQHGTTVIPHLLHTDALVRR